MTDVISVGPERERPARRGPGALAGAAVLLAVGAGVGQAWAGSTDPGGGQPGGAVELVARWEDGRATSVRGPACPPGTGVGVTLPVSRMPDGATSVCLAAPPDDVMAALRLLGWTGWRGDGSREPDCLTARRPSRSPGTVELEPDRCAPGVER